MSEETSTSNSPVAGASSEDIFPPSTAMDSVYSSSTSNLTQTFYFSSGNPRIEETKGIMHLFRNDVTSSTASDLPSIRSQSAQNKLELANRRSSVHANLIRREENYTNGFYRIVSGTRG